MDNPTIFELRKDRSFTNTISETFTFFRLNIKPLSQLYIKKVLPYFVFSVIGLALFTGGAYLFVDMFNIGIMTLSYIGIFVITIAFSLGFAALIAATLEYMRLYEKNKGITTTKEVWKGASSQLVWLIAAYIGRSLLFFIIFALMGITSFIGLGIFSSLIFVPLAVYVWVGTSIMFATHFIEETSFSNSLFRSFSLIENNWWRTFGLWLLLGLIFFSFSLVSQIIINMVTFTGAMLGGSGTVFIIVSVVIMVIFSIFSLLVYYLFYALFTIAEGLWYYSLVEKKQAISLEKKIGSIGE